jgi:outer membrane protein TolC
VAAQSAQIGIAEADLYPRLGVNGFIGYAAEDVNGLFDARNLTGWIIPSLQWNVLNYGRITNNVCAQDARLQAVTLQYQQTVLTAGREVEDSLVQFLQSQRQARHLEQTVADAQRSVTLVTKQFEGATTASRVWLDWQATPEGDVEARLSILTRWALEAHASGFEWGLRLPDAQLAPGSGRAHLDAALRMLALHGQAN